MSANDAYIAAFMGGSGSGKSAAVKQGLDADEGPQRLLIWDTMNEYGAYAKRAGSLREILEGTREAEFALRYVPERVNADKLVERFDAFCSIAYATGKCALVIEELQTVTLPGRAPASWSDCTLRGRHRGLRIIGISQRPANVDKNFFSNTTFVRTGRLNYADDIKVMANVLHVPAERISGLKPLEFVQRDMATGEVTDGTVTFGASPPKKPVKQKKVKA